MDSEYKTSRGTGATMDGAANMNRMYMVSVDRHTVDQLGSWKIHAPGNEASGVEPAHVHVTNPQYPGVRGKIWIGRNEQYSIGERQRYVFVPVGETLPISSREMKIILNTLETSFMENINGITDFFENVWQGGWYRNV